MIVNGSDKCVFTSWQWLQNNISILHRQIINIAKFKIIPALLGKDNTTGDILPDFPWLVFCPSLYGQWGVHYAGVSEVGIVKSIDGQCEYFEKYFLLLKSPGWEILT